MQRMRLHTSGIKVPKLGTIQDRTLRRYLTREAELDIHKTKLTMIQAMVAPMFKDDQARRDWTEHVGEIWNDYLSSLLLFEIPKETPKEAALKDYYDKVVSKLRPTITKDKKTGKLSVSGIDPKLL